MRSHYCGQVNESLIGQEIGVAGWVHRRRDHGGVIFVDLRDREGLLQVVFDPDRKDVFADAERLRGELREKARKEKNLALADGIRDGLTKIGVTLEDVPGSTIWRKS